MITNIEDLREELAKTIERVKNEPRFVPHAIEIKNERLTSVLQNRQKPGLQNKEQPNNKRL